jgi:polyribonucleotide nucleotidyltransferase
VNEWVDGKLGHKLRAAYPERNEMVNTLRHDFHNALEEKYGEEIYKDLKKEYDEAFTLAVHKDVRKGIVQDSIRPDGRKLTEHLDHYLLRPGYFQESMVLVCLPVV